MLPRYYRENYLPFRGDTPKGIVVDKIKGNIF
jgi:hypothetical protein